MDDIGLISWRHHVVWIQCSEDESHQVQYPKNIWSVARQWVLSVKTTETLCCAVTVKRNPLSWGLFFFLGNVRRSSIDDHCQTARSCAVDVRLQLWKHPHRSFIHSKIFRLQPFNMIEISSLNQSGALLKSGAISLYCLCDIAILRFSLFSIISTCPSASGFSMRYRGVFLFSLPFLHIYLPFSRATISEPGICSCFALRHQVAERNRDWLRSISSTVCLHDGSYQTTSWLSWDGMYSQILHCAIVHGH